MGQTPNAQRISISEYGTPVRLAKLAASLGIDKATFFQYVSDAAQRITSFVSVGKPFDLDAQQLRAEGVAGLIRLAPGIELEVRPKFLAAGDQTWREDFFAVATIVRSGRVLPREVLMGGSSLSAAAVK